MHSGCFRRFLEMQSRLARADGTQMSCEQSQASSLAVIARRTASVSAFRTRHADRQRRPPLHVSTTRDPSATAAAAVAAVADSVLFATPTRLWNSVALMTTAAASPACNGESRRRRRRLRDVGHARRFRRHREQEDDGGGGITTPQASELKVLNRHLVRS